jgi:mono/diheme cytochrome c family protein
MLSGLMRRRLALLALPGLAAVLVACGSEELELSKSDPNYRGAQLFTERCAGCHTLKVAGTQGSAVQANKREYKDGPNFDQRKEKRNQILYAIRNGGFSSGPMPQNIVVGKDAEAVADFLAKYSGK